MKKPDSLIEPLTKRELEILALLAAHQTNNEVAGSLNLSLNSVKWYVRQIYGKLGVDNRRQAVVKAGELGLLYKTPSSSKEERTPALPAGMVTFLFTDIEGSTPLWEQMPKEMAASVTQHHLLLRQAIETNGGQVFEIIGDSFHAAFQLTTQGLNAALAAQRAFQAAEWRATGPLKVRMGLHTGPAEVDPAGNAPYSVSHTLNRVARVMSAGYGGQILVSQEGKDLIERELPEGVILRDLGEHHLKGMNWIEHLYQAVSPDLPSLFPALATSIHHPNNLPLQLTSFIGREEEIAAIRNLLLHQRLVTLTGPGGTGKTRLSLQIAADMLDKFPDGVWFVELAAAADPELAPKIVAAVLGVRESTDKPLIPTLITFLRSKKILLILDNCEHLVEACASLANSLLRGCPNLVILDSSREILGIAGESLYRVPPLSMPDVTELPPLQDLGHIEAIRLFVERAQAAFPGFELTETNAAPIAQIVKRLDGIPLAIELAAARVRLLSPTQIADRLGDAFRLLTGGSRTVLPRHQTLRALIDWSYDLLSPKERTLFRRLSVFSGSWTLEAVEKVCSDPQSDPSLSAFVEDALRPEEGLDLLTQLVDKSLVLYYETSDSEVHYRILETIRQYAHEKLVEQKESETTRDQHLAYYLSLVETCEPFLRSHGQILWLNRLQGSLDNLRLALEWGLTRDVEAELRLASALMWFWHIRGLAAEGIQWLNQGLPKYSPARELQADPQARKVRAKALLALGALISLHESPRRSLPNLEESQTIYQSLGNGGRGGLAYTYRWMAAFAHQTGNLAGAKFLLHQAINIFEETGDRFGFSECLSALANLQDNPDDIKKIYLRVLTLKRETGDIDGIAFVLQRLSQIVFLEGDYHQAAIWLDDSLEKFRKVGNVWLTAATIDDQATICWGLGEYSQALNWIEEALVISHDNDDHEQYFMSLLHKGDFELSWGKVDAANYTLQDAARTAQEIGDQRLIGLALIYQGIMAWLSSHIAQAEEHWKAAESIGQAINDPYLIFLVSIWQGKSALWQGELAQAGPLLDRSLKLAIEMNDWLNIAYPLEALASLAIKEMNFDQAARRFGAANHFLSLIRNTLMAEERQRCDHELADLRVRLGEDRFIGEFQEGMRLTREQIKAWARLPSS